MKDNKVLAEQLSSSGAVKFRQAMSKALYEQWLEIIHSEDLAELYSKYKGFVIKAFVEDKNNFEDITIFNADKIKDNKPVISRTAVVAAVSALISKRFISVAKMKGVSEKVTGYFNSVMNKGGQNIVESINPKIKFRLSKSEYKSKIVKRFNDLAKDLDKTTKRNMINTIVDGLGKDISKQELHTKLIEAGKLLSKSRAELIARTESLAAYEYMKQETAKLNGIGSKTWVSMGKHTCPDCKALDGAVEPVEEVFKGYDVQFPPLHPNCECSVEYNAGLFKSNGLYNTEKSLVNPEAVWAGGESLVGKDKAIGLYYKQITDGEISFFEIKDLLTPTGQNQLLNKLK